MSVDRSVIPPVPAGSARKRNVFDVLDALGGSTGKTVLVRVDFNVPMNASGQITDDSRIKGALNTIQAILQHGQNAVLMSHMGRPKKVQAGKDDDETKKERAELSLQPVAVHLGTLIGQEVAFAGDCQAAGPQIQDLPSAGGGILLLENLRFYKAEEKNGNEFAQTLASYADAYVNDAFGTCHRAHASVSGVPALLDAKLCGIGCLVAKELAFLDFSQKSSGVAAVIGGSKVSTKLPVIKGLLGNVDTLVLGGGLAFTFMKAKGISIGSSLVEDSMIDEARDLMNYAADNGKKLCIPIDSVCANEFPKSKMDKADTKTFEMKEGGGIDDGWIGPGCGAANDPIFQGELGR